MEIKILLAFSCVLLTCIIFDLPLLIALAIGLAIFLGYGLWRNFSLASLFKMCWESIFTVRNILILFMMIGMLTAIWRASGTIPVIIACATQFINPSSFIVAAFLLNALISFLIGTSFGTVATMGVICMSIAQTLQIDTFWVAGAIISGIYFGDRSSPVSTSALLVSMLTGTELYNNIKLMFKTGLIPLLLTSIIYFAIGCVDKAPDIAIDVGNVFATSFNMSTYCMLPALVILVLALFKINVKITMLASIFCAVLIGLLLQNLTLYSIAKTLFFGYEAPDAQLAKMLNGGGIISMVKVFCIVCIASCYSGIFKGTGLLDNLQESIQLLCTKIGNFPTILLTAIVTGMIACNQTLNIMLAHQLCNKLDISQQELAIDLENTAVLISPCIPWNIAVAVPLAILGVTPICILAACYLYLLPLYRLILSICHPSKANSIF